MSKAIRLALLSGILFAAGAEAGATGGKGPVIPQRLKPAEKALLMQLKEGGDAGIRVPDQNAPEFITLLKARWVDVNPATVEGTSIAARLSASGKEKVETFRSARDPEAVNTRPAPGYSAEPEEYDVTQIAVKARQQRSVYDLDKLTRKGLSLFYPAPAEFPADKDFAATKAGTVGGFNRKSKEAYDALPADERPAEGPAVIKAINDTKEGVRGVRFVRMS